MTPLSRDIPPIERRLRVFAVDPGTQQELATSKISKLVVRIPWEQLEVLETGIRGEYLEVVSYNASCHCVYRVADFNNTSVLVEDGYQANLDDPRFHQQMVYAVASSVIQKFENVLGRRMQWTESEDGQFVKRLKLYPYGFWGPNAYFIPKSNSIFFGYFQAKPACKSLHYKGETVFTSLSFDIIVHETVHALLSGLRPGFSHPTNPDVRAFHEAFADLVALLLRLSYPEIIAHELRRCEGKLVGKNVLLRLGHEFGSTTGEKGALRSALDWCDEERVFKISQRTLEGPHAWEDSYQRGSVLVAAVLETFLEIYGRRTVDLIRIAKRYCHGPVDLSSDHDLVKRLSEEASQTAESLLILCIRAIDYTPPVDITFSDYLRAMITASREHEPHDCLGYRVALIESCRKRRIFAPDLSTMTEQSLVWDPYELESVKAETFAKSLKRVTEKQLNLLRFGLDRASTFEAEKRIKQNLRMFLKEKLLVGARRDRVTRKGQKHRKYRRRPSTRQSYKRTIAKSLGLVLGRSFKVESARPARRPSSRGWVEELVVVVRQDFQRSELSASYHGGATLLINPETGRIKYCVKKTTTEHSVRPSQRPIGARADLSPYRST